MSNPWVFDTRKHTFGPQVSPDLPAWNAGPIAKSRSCANRILFLSHGGVLRTTWSSWFSLVAFPGYYFQESMTRYNFGDIHSWTAAAILNEMSYRISKRKSFQSDVTFQDSSRENGIVFLGNISVAKNSHERRIMFFLNEVEFAFYNSTCIRRFYLFFMNWTL